MPDTDGSKRLPRKVEVIYSQDRISSAGRYVSYGQNLPGQKMGRSHQEDRGSVKLNIVQFEPRVGAGRPGEL